MLHLGGHLGHGGQAVGYTPIMVANGGTGTLTLDGGFGTDTAFFDMAFLLGGLDGNPAAVCRVFQSFNVRLDWRFGTTGIPRVVLKDNATTAVTLVDWTASAAHDGPGTWLFHTVGIFSGTPSFSVSKIEAVEVQPGMWATVGDWVALAGSFTTAPVVGTLANNRAGVGPDYAWFNDIAGASPMNAKLGYVWWSNSTPLLDSAFAAGGVLTNPHTLPNAVCLLTGYNITADQSASAKTWTAAGAWVGGGPALPAIATAPEWAANVLAYDAASATAGFVPGAVITQGGVTAPIVAHEALSATVGNLFLGAITGGAFADNVVFTTASGSATANGVSAPYAQTVGDPIAAKPGTYNGTVTGLATTYEHNATAVDAGAVVFTPVAGNFPTETAGRYVRAVESATVNGVPVVNKGAWSAATVTTGGTAMSMLAADQWFPAVPTAVSGSVDRLDTVYTTQNVDLYWSTGQQPALDGSAFPTGREATTAGTPTTVSFQRLYYDGATATAGFVDGATVSQTGGKSGVIYHHASLTPTTGVLWFASITGGAFSDNVAITAPNAAAVANGASASVSCYKRATASAMAGTPARDYREFIAGTDDVRRTRLRATGFVSGVAAPYSLEKTVPHAPAPTSARSVSRAVMRKEGMFLSKRYGGDARQFPRDAATTPANPNLVWMGVDITSPLYSKVGFGEFWNTPDMRGLRAVHSNCGIGIDAEDANRVLFYGSNASLASGTGNNYNSSEGIYLSTDGGATMAQVLSLPDSAGSNRGVTRYRLKYIIAEPGTSATPTTRTWHAVHSERPWGSFVLGPSQMYKSSNGGASWSTDGASVAAGSRGQIYCLATRDNGSGGYDLYMACDQGLFRRAAGASTWTEMTLSSPGGQVSWVQVCGQVVYAMRQGNGLYKSAANGTTFSRIYAYNGSHFAVSKPAPNNWIFACSRSTNVTARWSQDGGATWTHTKGGSTVDNEIDSIPAPGQLDDFSHNLWTEPVFFIPHETDETECLVMRKQHMGRIKTAKNGNGNIEAIYSSTGFDYSRINSISWGGSYDEYAMGATDRACMYTDNGPDWVHDAPTDKAFKQTIYQKIEGAAGEYVDYQAAGPIIFENNGHKRVLWLLGEGKPDVARLPIVMSPKIEDSIKLNGSATGTTGTMTALVMPKGSRGGTYELRCTTAGTSGAVFTLHAPVTDPGSLGASMGTTSGMGGQSIAGKIGGTNITFTLTAAAAAWAAGSNPSRFTWYYNPVGTTDLLSGASGKAYGTGIVGERNPTNAARGCSGKRRYVMSSGGAVTVDATLDYEFWGYSDGNVIWGLSGSAIKRSANEGGAWTSVITGAGTVTAMFPSKINNNRCYYTNKDGQAYRVSGGVQTKVFDFLDVMAAIEGTGKTYLGTRTPPRPPAFSIVEDPHDEDILTVSMGDGGGCTMAFRSTVGGGAASNWAAVPEAMLISQELFICPYTGVVASTSRHGTVLFSQPSGYFASHGITEANTAKARNDRFIGDAGNYVGV